MDNKLNVRGGVLASCQVLEDRMVRVSVVVLTQSEAGDEATKAIKAPKVTIEVVNPAGETCSSLAGEMPEGTLGGENGFAIFRCEIEAETDGRYALIVTSGTSSVSLPLRVRPHRHRY